MDHADRPALPVVRVMSVSGLRQEITAGSEPCTRDGDRKPEGPAGCRNRAAQFIFRRAGIGPKMLDPGGRGSVPVRTLS